MTRISGPALLLASWVMSTQALADAEVTFRGTLVESVPCQLNNDNTVDVSFGETLSVKKVGDGIYRQPVEMELQCETRPAGLQLTLTWTGLPVSFDSDNATVVTAEQAALGVKMYAGGQPLKLDEPLKITADTLPLLEAVLVKDAGADLAEGAFSAKGTFRAEYQ